MLDENGNFVPVYRDGEYDAPFPFLSDPDDAWIDIAATADFLTEGVTVFLTIIGWDTPTRVVYLGIDEGTDDFHTELAGIHKETK